MKQFYAEWQGHLAELNFDSLSPEGRIDYILFRNHLQHELRQLELQNKFHEEEAPLLPFAGAILDLEDARLRIDPVDSPKAAAVLADLAKQIEQSRDLLNPFLVVNHLVQYEIGIVNCRLRCYGRPRGREF